jgi:putative ATPase
MSIEQYAPLAERMRPKTIEQYMGQAHLLAEGKTLYRVATSGHVHSMILWGPPGTGKTTLAYLLAKNAKARVEKVSAVLVGVKDIREIVLRAERALSLNQQTVLFVDEVHRFNKSQQDAFLPHVESGTIILIGATTENPSFQLNNALLSRARVYVLKALTDDDLMALLEQALTDNDRGLGARGFTIALEDKKRLVQSADGDGRSLLNMLEVLADFSEDNACISSDALDEVLSTSLRRFDNHGDAFYDQISALHKSVRGSNPDAALYWFCRMIDGGCDPHYIARRILRMAYEDIGLADPRGTQLALEGWQTYERLGSPEGELAIAQAVMYLACAAKSNASYMAYNDAMAFVKQTGSKEVPLHLRNAPTKLMKSLDYGKDYRYAHNEADAYAAGESYFPDDLKKQTFYKPAPRGLEIKIMEKLARLRAQDKRVKT